MIDFATLIKTLSYFGIFISGFISSSTIFLPLPLYVIIVFSKELGLNIYLTIFSASLGVTIGEITGYLAGLGIRSLKEMKKIKKYEKIFRKYGFLSIFLFAALPLPFDIIGMLAGYLKYDLKKFLIAVFFGKLIKITIVAFIGTEIIEILKIFI